MVQLSLNSETHQPSLNFIGRIRCFPISLISFPICMFINLFAYLSFQRGLVLGFPKDAIDPLTNKLLNYQSSTFKNSATLNQA